MSMKGSMDFLEWWRRPPSACLGWGGALCWKWMWGDLDNNYMSSYNYIIILSHTTTGTASCLPGVGSII